MQYSPQHVLHGKEAGKDPFRKAQGQPVLFANARHAFEHDDRHAEQNGADEGHVEGFAARRIRLEDDFVEPQPEAAEPQIGTRVHR